MTSLNNNVLDAFKASGIPVASFIQDIVRFFREFEAKHADLIIQVTDNINAGTSTSAQFAYVRELGNDLSTHVLRRELLQPICYC